MKRFLVLHYGFIPPTANEMEKWNAWFDSIDDRKPEKGHFPHGMEISSDGFIELPFERNSITGYTIFSAKDFEEAGNIAKSCPIVDLTRVYEIKSEEEFSSS